jgi:hypothetical protein
MWGAIFWRYKHELEFLLLRAYVSVGDKGKQTDNYDTLWNVLYLSFNTGLWEHLGMCFTQTNVYHYTKPSLRSDTEVNLNK